MPKTRKNNAKDEGIGTTPSPAAHRSTAPAPPAEPDATHPSLIAIVRLLARQAAEADFAEQLAAQNYED